MPRPKQPRQLKKCKMCDVQFECLPSYNKQYCSKKCANADPEIKQKQRVALKLTWEEKGHPMTQENSRKKHKHSMIEKYGVEHALKHDDILSKSKQTKLKKYGNENFNNLDKSRETKLKKYGSANYNGSVKRMISKYNDILTKWKHVVPMFTELEYFGVENTSYSFQCIECSNEFHSSVDNGIIPICRICTPIQSIVQSKGEKEIVEYIKSLVPDCVVIEKDRLILSGKELDIVLPEYNIAIEYNGLYWHSESKLQDKKYHLNKSKKASSAGYTLIHIFDYQWHQKQDIVKSIISTKLNCNTVIPARKCIVKEIKSKVKNEFLNKTHLHGSCNSRVNLGLYYNDQLISVCTLGRARYTKQYEWELIRFSSELNCTVVGGFSKLLSYFIKTYKPKNIFTYCDRSISNGNAYFKSNFKLTGVTTSNYFYFKGANVYSREQFQKHKLQSKIAIFDNSITEYENMLINGFDRYWDCGNFKFLLEIN
jgi:hypothetical protein